MHIDKTAIILMSGGLDSTTVAAIAIKQGFKLHAVGFDYGQRHKIELEKLREAIKQFPEILSHKVIPLNLRDIGGSSLTSDIDVPKNKYGKYATTIPNTYVPARNTIFLSIALGYAETLEVSDIFIGANAVDYSNYPDCRQEYLTAFENMANLATRMGVEGKKLKIHAPLMQMGKAEIIKTGITLGVDYSNTLSCYDPDINGISCGNCDACSIRLGAFKEVGINDPIEYA